MMLQEMIRLCAGICVMPLSDFILFGAAGFKFTDPREHLRI